MPSSRTLLDAIPHRPPFLFVDEIIEVADTHIMARKHVDPESDFFRGHYPGKPIMPGVLVCEACFQAGALLIAHRIGGYDPAAGVPVLTRITDARFKRIVRPGDTLELEATIDEELPGAYYLTGKASVEGILAVRVGFVCMMAKTEVTPR